MNIVEIHGVIMLQAQHVWEPWCFLQDFLLSHKVIKLLHFQSELGTGMNVQVMAHPSSPQLVSRRLRFKLTFWKTLFISGQVTQVAQCYWESWPGWLHSLSGLEKDVYKSTTAATSSATASVLVLVPPARPQLLQALWPPLTATTTTTKKHWEGTEMPWKWLCITMYHQRNATLPKTNIASEKWWLGAGRLRLPFGNAYVSFRQVKTRFHYHRKPGDCNGCHIISIWNYLQCKRYRNEKYLYIAYYWINPSWTNYWLDSLCLNTNPFIYS